MVGVNESQTVTPTGGNEVDLSGGVVLYYIYVISGAHKGRSVQLRGTAFESDQLEHLPYMDLSSSGA